MESVQESSPQIDALSKNIDELCEQCAQSTTAKRKLPELRGKLETFVASARAQRIELPVVDEVLAITDALKHGDFDQALGRCNRLIAQSNPADSSQYLTALKGFIACVKSANSKA
eukprot:m.480562 g.480562  ORF g.480562 m.480562 type:complete len:115 (+) comp57176_c0_seq10:1382-1726(+)